LSAAPRLEGDPELAVDSDLITHTLWKRID
jgi:hypothetical protein